MTLMDKLIKRGVPHDVFAMLPASTPGDIYARHRRRMNENRALAATAQGIMRMTATRA